MEQTELQAVWSQVLGKLQGSLPDAACKKWLSPVAPLSLEGTRLLLGAPNDFTRKWIRERYLALLEDTLFDVIGEHCTIDLENLDLPAKEAEFPPTEAAKPKRRPRKKLPQPRSSDVQTTLLDSFEGLTEDLPNERDGAMGPIEGYSSYLAAERIAPGDASTLNPKYTFETFVMGNSNRVAHAAAQAVAESPGKVFNPLFLYGGVGLGKTHLMHAIGHRILEGFPDKRVLYVSSETFTNDFVNAVRDGNPEFFRQRYRTIDVLMVDDVQFLSGKDGTQEEFFHTFNTLHNSGRAIVLSSDRPPHEVQRMEERLLSRFEWGMLADVQPPDFETRLAILRKKAQIDHLNVPNDVMASIANSVDRNIRELEGALTRVVAYAAITHQPITVPIVEQTLKNLFPGSKERRITVDLIQGVVADYYKIQVEDMQARTKKRSIAYPRQVAMYLSRELTDASLPQIGQSFGGRDHTTVLHACEKIKSDREADKDFDTTVCKLIDRIQNG